MQRHKMLPISAFALGAMYSAAGYAHVGHHAMSGFNAGLLHPVTGLDHLAAAVAVGMLAGRQGGRAIWALPLMFLGVLLAASLTAIAGLVVPGAELGVLLSVLAAGLLLAARQWGPMPLIAGVIAFAGLAHGYIHGYEAAAVGTSSFVGGLGLMTAALVGAGVVLGRIRVCRPATRLAGGVMAIAALATGA